MFFGHEGTAHLMSGPSYREKRISRDVILTNPEKKLRYVSRYRDDGQLNHP